METNAATERIHNFSAGPAVLPVSVLEQVQREMMCLPGAGASILEISHRSAKFTEILRSAKAAVAELIGLPDDYHVLFMQGGSRLQFSMAPMNLLRGRAEPAEFVVTGSWSQNALKEAQKEGPTKVVWDGGETNYDRLPAREELEFSPRAPFVYFASNETIQGVQYSNDPDYGDAPLVCDASSDFLSRPYDISRYGLLYACAQKNAGPAGVTVVIIRDDMLERSGDDLPGYLNYRLQVEQDSRYNTPPTFAVYVLGLVCRWLLDDIGGLEAMRRQNTEKAALLYDEIDASEGFFRGHARRQDRSQMNVTFRLPSEALESEFLGEAESHGLCSLAGHRSVGGVRASIYNAMPLEGVAALRDFMRDYRARRA